MGRILQLVAQRIKGLLLPRIDNVAHHLRLLAECDQTGSARGEVQVPKSINVAGTAIEQVEQRGLVYMGSLAH